MFSMQGAARCVATHNRDPDQEILPPEDPNLSNDARVGLCM